VQPVLGDLFDDKTTITVNGAGKFLVSGPECDTEVTGRKTMADTFGGWAPHFGRPEFALERAWTSQTWPGYWR
jgi:S-adenosylmethionine synthetase